MELSVVLHFCVALALSICSRTAVSLYRSVVWFCVIVLLLHVYFYSMNIENIEEKKKSGSATPKKEKMLLPERILSSSCSLETLAAVLVNHKRNETLRKVEQIR